MESSQLHAPATAPPGERGPGIHLIGGGMGTGAGLDNGEENLLPLLGIKLRPSGP